MCKVIIFICVIFFNCLYSQNINIDTFFEKDFKALKQEFYLMDSTSKTDFSRKYLSRAKLSNNIIKIANGYYFFSELNLHQRKAINYADSIIQITKNSNHKEYPALGYIQKGTQLYYDNNHHLALDNFIKARKLASKHNIKFQLIIIKHYIGLLKNVNKNVEESLIIFKNNFNFIINNNLDLIHRKQYLKSLYALSDSYAKNRIFDTAQVYYRKGLFETHEKDLYFYPHFLTGYGINSFHRKEYIIAIDSLKKASKLLQNKKKIYLLFICIYMNHIGICKNLKEDLNFF